MLYQLSYLGGKRRANVPRCEAFFSSFETATSTTMPAMRSSSPSRRLAGLTLAGLALALPAALQAWKPATQQAIALEAAALAPPDLRRQIERHQREYLRGAVAPLGETDALRHMKNADGSGTLDRTIASEIAAATQMLSNHRPFAEIVERLGRISHFVADANLPLNTNNSDPREGTYFRDFLEYADGARPRFALVFYGFGAEWRSARDLDAWTRATLTRGRRLYPSIGEEYRRIAAAGLSRGRDGFDDRSTAFAVAALSYSHAVSDVARALRHVWLSAGGFDPRRRLAQNPDGLVLVDPGAAR